jgi:hypothetical protein
VSIGRSVDRSQDKLSQQIREAEEAQQALLDKLVESQARLSRLRKHKEFVEKKSSEQSARLEAELDREEAEEAALQGALAGSAVAPFDADNVALPDQSSLSQDIDRFLGLQQGGLSPEVYPGFDFGSPPTTQGS